MKFSKIIAAAASLSMVAAMAIPASAAASEGYMYTVQKSWTKKAPADQEETPVKFMYDADGNPVLKNGATDLNKWDSGEVKFNGQWAQIILTDDDLSAITIDFTIDMDDATQVEFHADDPEKPDDNVYQVFNVFGGDAQSINTCPHAEINEGLGEHEEMEFVNTGAHTFTYSYTGADIQAAVDAGGAEFGQNEDGTSTLGFNIQVGHFTNAKVTAVVKSTTGNIYDGAGDTESSQPSGESSAAGGDTTSSKKADDSSKADASSKAADTSTKSTTTTTTTTKTTGTTAATGDATDSSAKTGATAGLVFAGIALAGAAVVASKRK